MKTETRVGIFVIGSLLVFLYLSLNIGALRMDHKNYDTYITFFEDTGGLDIKSIIKTSGVKIGWVDSIILREGGRAEVHMKINKSYQLALNAYAMIQQESLLGQKIIELDQGDFSTGILTPGSTLTMPGKSSTNIGDLIDQFKDISQSVGDIAHAFRDTFASREGKKRLDDTLLHASRAAKDIALSANTIERLLKNKAGRVGSMIDNLDDTSLSLKKGVPSIVGNIADVAADVRGKVIPELTKAGPALEAFEDTAIQAREGFREIEEVMEKVNSGKGLIGKLINEDETYADLKKTVQGLKDYVSRVQSLQIYIDMHSENLFKYDTHKGYMDLKIRPASDYFYQVQIATDEYGTIKREVEDVTRRNENGDVLSTTILDTPRDVIEFPDQVERVTRTKNTVHFGFQFGKRFKRLAFRIGLFESAVGGAVDYYVPLNTDLFHWITSVEAFDFQGVKRLDDNRPHVKWINKVFFMKNLYTTFGIDDLVSRRSASPFFGAGLKFNDADLKYFLSMFSGMAGKVG